MNVLCSNPSGGAFYHITEAWGNAFKRCGYKFLKWDGNKDTWEKFQPNIYLGCSGHRQNIPQDLRKKFNTRIGIHCNPYGQEKLKPVHGTDVNEPQGTINWTVSMNPDFVFGYGLQSQERYWEFYKKKHGIPWYGVPNAGDMTHYYPEENEDFSCDVGYVGGRWPYKAHNINKYLAPVLKRFSNYKLYGWGGWEGFNWKQLPNGAKEDRLVFSNAKVCPAVCEPHTSVYNIDWPERIFKTPLCNGLTISDPIEGFEQYLPKDIFPMAENPRRYLELAKYYIQNHDERKELKEKQREYIIDNHTYFDRIKTFFQASGFKSELEKIDKVKLELRS